MHTPAPHPFAGRDARWLVDSRAQRRRDHPFLIWEPFEGDAQRWSYEAFAQAVRRFAAGLHQRGLQPGDRVLVHMDNCPELLIAWLGCGYAGMVAVTTNAKSTLDELTYFAAHSRAVAAITQPKFAALVQQAAPAARWIALSDTNGGAPAERPAGFDAFAAVDGDPNSLPARPADPMAPFSIQYTSGTTARPKAVLWTHGNLLWGARMSALHEDLREDDVHLVHLPLFHTNAQIYSMAASLWVGGTAVLQPGFSASRFWPVSLAHGCTWTSMVPFCLRALMAHPVPPDHRYRFFGNGLCDMPTDPHFRVRTIGWWGMTETVSHGTVGSPHSPDPSMSMGRASPGYEILVLDDAMQPVPVGGVGDLYVRGHRGLSLFLEYADNPEATAKAFTPDGLFITGDRVRVAEDGTLFFADRSKDMLKVGGENVAASELEQAIMVVPGVQEVAVVGKPHPMLDEVPVAFVLPAPKVDGADLHQRVVAACRASLASFKQPAEVRIVEALPRATLDKIAKAVLREQLAQEASSAA